MKIDVSVDARAVSLQLDRMRANIIGPAAASALNRTATSVRADAVRSIRALLPLPAGSIRKRLAIERATKTKLTARIVARRDYDPPLGIFAPQWRQRQPVGATIKLPGKARQVIAGAFVARTSYGRPGVFRRQVGVQRGKPRAGRRADEKLQFLRASDIGLPTITSAFLQAGADAALLGRARERFRAALAREIAFRSAV
jgi:hypothetical protein